MQFRFFAFARIGLSIGSARRARLELLALVLASAQSAHCAPATALEPPQGMLHDASATPDLDASEPAFDAQQEPAPDASVDEPEAGRMPDLPGSSDPPPNPYAAERGFATQHGDTCASDTSPLPGPGAQQVDAKMLGLLAVCPSVLVASDDMPIAVCTQLANQTPAIYLLDPASGSSLASRELTKGMLFGGVYPYLDRQDFLLVVDGAQQLLRVGHRKASNASWELFVERSFSLAPSVEAHCGSSSCDGIVGLAPDYDGRIWFATDHGLVGVVSSFADQPSVKTVSLEPGERVLNSISTAPAGTAVLSDHALYLFTADASGAPTAAFRAPYDRGSARKPGQLSQGSGSSPTFFGPRTGAEYLTITDNAQPLMNLLVYRSDGAGEPICTTSVPAPAGMGSENSPIGSGRSVIIAGTYGYPYPAVPDGQAESVPTSAPLSGGMVRIDVREDESGCDVVWTNEMRSSAVPKLSRADDLIYTIERQTVAKDGSSGLFDAYVYSVIAADTGDPVYQQTLSGVTDTMQLAGTLGPDRTLYQGTATGIVRITP
ncbi:MAG: hypothetical protein QM778_06350 [Myxococcales bacterium]